MYKMKGQHDFVGLSFLVVLELKFYPKSISQFAQIFDDRR